MGKIYNSIDELDAAVASGELSFREANQHLERLRAKSFRLRIQNGQSPFVEVRQNGEKVATMSLTAANLVCVMEKADALSKLVDMAHWITRGTFKIQSGDQLLPYPIVNGNKIDARAVGVEESF